jgi:hypothetical protein
MNCRHCAQPLEHVFLDLGFAPPSNAYLTADDLHAPETWYPLKLYVCAHCWLVQTEDYARADELFRRTTPISHPPPATWLAHAGATPRPCASACAGFADSFVIEVAANDGYLLRHVVAAGIPCLGIEPTAGTAAAAEQLGIPVLREFFGEATGKATGRCRAGRRI